jgi:hypothetical protein
MQGSVKRHEDHERRRRNYGSTSVPAYVSAYVLACILLFGTALRFAVASPAPAADDAKQPTATSKPLSVITPIGAGGLGDVPPKPQNATDPLEPCSSQTVECTVTWKPGSTVCKQQGTASSCTTLYQGAHATLAEAKERCEKINRVGTDSGAQSCGPCQGATSAKDDCKERCKKQCDKIHDRCHKDCTENDPTQACRNQCNQEYSKCLRECDRDCKED